VAVPFLVTALTGTGVVTRPGLRGAFVTTAHNAPARDVFPKAGFTQKATGDYVLGSPQNLPNVTSGPHLITFHGPPTGDRTPAEVTAHDSDRSVW
jgi:hypothetical protein